MAYIQLSPFLLLFELIYRISLGTTILLLASPLFYVRIIAYIAVNWYNIVYIPFCKICENIRKTGGLMS